MAKIHWSEGKAPGDVVYVTLCGRLEPSPAVTVDLVTCLVCKRKLLDLVPDQSAAHYVGGVFGRSTGFDPEALEPPPPLFDPISDLPVLSPETWHMFKRRHHRCADCMMCRHFIEIEVENHCKPWVKRHRLDSEGFRWPSVTAALEWYHGVRRDGFSQGTAAESLEKLAKLGVSVRVGGNKVRALEEADDAHAIDVALGLCYLGDSERGLSRAERLYCLFAVSLDVGRPHEVARTIRDENPRVENLTGPMVTGVVRSGKDVVYEQLRIRGFVPPR